MIGDKAGYKSVWTIRKYKDYNDYMKGERPYEVSEFQDNILLNEGITRLLNLLTGGGGTNFGNASAWLDLGADPHKAGTDRQKLLERTLEMQRSEATRYFRI